jgi:hypothetical protein
VIPGEEGSADCGGWPVLLVLRSDFPGKH